MNNPTGLMVGQVLTSFLLLTVYYCVPAQGQGISEAAAVYGMPKGAVNPSGFAGALQNVYSAGGSSLQGGQSMPRTNGKQVNLCDDGDQLEMAGKQSVIAWTEGAKLEKQGKIAAAESKYRQALNLRRPVWGDKDPSLPQILSTIGLLAERQNKLTAAEDCYRDLLSVTAKRYGSGSWELNTPLSKLVKVLCAQKRYGEASEDCRLVYQLTARKFGTAHDTTITAAINYAGTLAQAGKQQEAQKFLADLIGISAGNAAPRDGAPPQLVAQYQRLMGASGSSTSPVASSPKVAF